MRLLDLLQRFRSAEFVWKFRVLVFILRYAHCVVFSFNYDLIEAKLANNLLCGDVEFFEEEVCADL